MEVSTMPIPLNEIVDPATIEVPAEVVDVRRGMRPEDFNAKPAQPHYNGTRFRPPPGPNIYLVDQGYARWIVNPATYNALFRDWDGVVTGDGAAALFDLVPPGGFLSGNALERGIRDRRTVWFIDFYAKRRIANPHTMDVYHFSWDAIYTVPDLGLDLLGLGPEISA
jgi:hypothetical protein